jgi:hypothetical protein
MKTKKQIVFPQHAELHEQLGENIKLARKRRKLTTIMVAERTGIGRNTLYLLKKRQFRCFAWGIINVLRVLNLHDDILKLAADDELGRKIQDIELLK